MDIDAWLRAACEDADRRGLSELKPLLETLARSTSALRTADRKAREADITSGHISEDGPR
jgi:hypothetical protein